MGAAELYLDPTIVDADHIAADRANRRRSAHFSITHIEAGAVQGTYQPIATQPPFIETGKCVRAAILDTKELVFDPAQHDFVPFDGKTHWLPSDPLPKRNPAL